MVQLWLEAFSLEQHKWMNLLVRVSAEMIASEREIDQVASGLPRDKDWPYTEMHEVVLYDERRLLMDTETLVMLRSVRDDWVSAAPPRPAASRDATAATTIH